MPAAFGQLILDVALVRVVMRWQTRRATGERAVMTGGSSVGGGEGAR